MAARWFIIKISLHLVSILTDSILEIIISYLLHLILSYFILFYLILSYFILFYLILSFFILFYLTHLLFSLSIFHSYLHLMCNSSHALYFGIFSFLLFLYSSHLFVNLFKCLAKEKERLKHQIRTWCNWLIWSNSRLHNIIISTAELLIIRTIIKYIKYILAWHVQFTALPFNPVFR